MNDPLESSFDRAETEENGPSDEYDGEEPESCCQSCNRPLIDEYYESGGLWLCPSCRDEIDRGLRSGSGLERFVRANVFGIVAAVAGFAIYFTLLKVTGYEIGLVSILVGLMVGGAVKRGSRHRGGWLYQIVAMFWVYTAIGFSYGSLIIPDMFAEAVRAERPKAGAEVQPVAVAKPAPDPAPVVSFGEIARVMATLAVLLLVIVYSLPIVAGFHAPMGLVLIAIALWEAWKMNVRIPIVINGPFAVEQG